MNKSKYIKPKYTYAKYIKKIKILGEVGFGEQLKWSYDL